MPSEAIDPDLPRIWIQPKYNSFNGLRAVAVVAVFFTHYSQFWGVLWPQYYLWTGVDLFFVLSGFLITGILYDSLQNPHFFRDFYVRRALRIFPLFYFLFLLLLLITHLLRLVHSPLIWSYFLYVGNFLFPFWMQANENIAVIQIPSHGLAVPIADISHFWSLCVEEQFYLLWPWLFLFLSRRTLVGVLVGLVAACVVVRWGLVADLVAAGWQGPHINAVVYSFAPGHFDAFAAGALIALFRDDIAQRPALARSCMIAALSLAGLYVGIFVTLQAMRSTFFHAFHNVVAGVLVGDFKEVFVYPVMWGLAASLLMLILAGERWVLTLCRAPWVQTIGRMSFGLYIVHIPVFMLVRVLVAHTSLGELPHPVDRVLILAIVLPISCGLAAASWHFLEQPVLRIRSRFG